MKNQVKPAVKTKVKTTRSIGHPDDGKSVQGRKVIIFKNSIQRYKVTVQYIQVQVWNVKSKGLLKVS